MSTSPRGTGGTTAHPKKKKHHVVGGGLTVAPPAVTGTSQPPDVPAALWKAILRASAKYNVPPDVLAAIWRGESGSSYPNPYVNSSGYGGLFGTKDWNGSTQQQADLAASVFHDALVQTHGDIWAANGIYATGKPNPGLYGHAGLPRGTVAGYGAGGGVSASSIVGDVASGLGVGLANAATGGVAGDVAGALGSLNPFGGISNAAKAVEFIFSVRGLQVMGGGIMVLMGLYLLARQAGLGNVTQLAPGPVGAAARAIPSPQPTVQPSAQPRPRTRRVVHHYHPVGSAASERNDRPPAGDYDPSSSEIPF